MSKTIQVTNTPEGTYDVLKPLPYPYHVNEDGSIARQDFWRGEPARLLGFQVKADEQVVDVFAAEWLSDDVNVDGMYPVFMDADGTIWNHAFPVMIEELVR